MRSLSIPRHPVRDLRAICAVLLAAALPFALGCDDTVNPIIESDRRFSLFATLDMNSDQQMLRVIPIRETILEDPGALQVEVRSVDLTNGIERTWRDSILTFPDGLVAHIFVTQLRLESQHRYRLEVLENGVVVTFAETTIPLRPMAVIQPVQIRTGSSGFVATQRVRWYDLPEIPFEVTYWYRFYSYRSNRFENVLMPHVPGSAPSTEHPGSRDFYIDLNADRAVLDKEYSSWRFDPFVGIGMTIVLLDDAFVPPGGKFDRDILSQPGAFTNVTGGFGFVGSVGRFSTEWVMADSTARQLGYRPLGGALKAELEARMANQ